MIKEALSEDCDQYASIRLRPSYLLSIVAKVTAEPEEFLKTLDATSFNQLHAFIAQPTNSSVQSKD